MRKLFICLLVFFLSIQTYATTYYWIGGTSGNWNTFSNWSFTSGGSAASFYPASNDAVIFDNGQSITVSYDLAGNDIGFSSFSVKNNTQLTLVNTINLAAGSARSFTINNGAPTSYYEVVEAGSSLSLKSNTNTIFSLGSDNLSSGRMVFNGKIYCIIQDNLNTNYGPRLNATLDSMIINNLYYIGPSITSVGINPVGNKFRFGPNSVYQIDKDGGIYLFGKWESGSLIKITGTRSSFPLYWNGFYPANYQLGGFEIDAPNASASAITNINIPSSNGLIFQNDFKITNLGTSAGIILTSIPNITVKGNMLISNGKVSLANSSTTAGTISVNGNLVVGSGAIVDLQAQSAALNLKVGGNITIDGIITELGTSTNSSLECNGNSSQSISVAGTISNDVSFSINNSSGVIALTDVALSSGTNAKLNLVSGNLNALTNNKIIYVRNSSIDAINGGAVNSHIIGKLKRASNSVGSYDFPVSDNETDMAKATINVNNTNVSDWTTEFIRNNTNSNIGLPSNLTSIVPYRWDIVKSGSAEATQINLKYGSITNNGISNPSSTKIVRWNTTAWESLGGTTDNAGGINSANATISNFGSFSLGNANSASPILSANSLNSFGNVCLNAVAGPNSFDINGDNLTTTSITIGPLNGFSFSSTSNGSYTNTLVINQTGGSLSPTTVYVKFTPTVVQSYNGNIPVSGGGAVSITVAATGEGVSQTTPSFTPIAAICSGSQLNALPTISNNNINGTWSPALNNLQTTTYTFTPAGNQCATTTTMTISVTQPTVPSFTPIASICEGSQLNALPTISNNNINGTWSPALNNLQTTTYTFTPAGNQCATTTTMTISVTQPTVPSFTPIASICEGSQLISLPTISNNNINGTWSPALNNLQTTTYTFTPSANQCASTTTMMISVRPSPCNNTFLFPNPSNGNFTINIPSEFGTEGKTILIFDAKGALVYQEDFTKPSIDIFINKFNSGIYFVKISNKSGALIKTGKIMIH